MRHWALLIAACGNAPPGDGTPIVRGQLATSLAVSSQSLYWASEVAVQMADLDGAGMRTLAMLPPQNFHQPQIVVDDSAIYWTEVTSADGVTGSLMMMPFADSTPRALVASVASPSSLAIDADSVYCVAGNEIMKVAKLGGSPQVIAIGNQPSDLIVDGGSVLWVNVVDSTVMSVPSSGGNLMQLFADVGVMHVAVDGTNVYAAEQASDGSILAIPRGGGSVRKLVQLENVPSAIAVDPSHIYWATQLQVRRADLDGSNTETLAENRNLTTALVLDDMYIYWATGGLAVDQQPGIAKLAKPK